MFDPHDIILKAAKLDKSFKSIISFLKWKNILQQRKKSRKILKKLKKKKTMRTKRYFSKKDIKIISSFSFPFRNKKKWYKNFWSKIKLNYFIKKINFRPRKIKKKETRSDYRGRKIRVKNRYKLLYRIRRKWVSRKKYTNTSGKSIYKKGVRRRMAKFVWLSVIKSKKKQKTWWSIRIIIRKTAIYYGFKNLKKFRFTNKFNDSAMKIKAYSNNKLEFMLNIFLLRLNIFDNIYVSNNFIKFSSLIEINFKNTYNPFQYVKLNQIVSFSNLKKMQGIFKKRIIFSKYFFVKNYKFKKKCLLSKKIIKIIANVPLYIHYDYQIMCFSIYRLPNKKELLNFKKGINDSWAIDTRLKYN